MAEKYTQEQLNNVDKSFLIQMFLNQQEQVEKLTKEVSSLNEKMQRILEQMALANRDRFGRSSEKLEETAQISFLEVDGEIVFFNEAEAVCNLDAEEPEDLVLPRKKKAKGKKPEYLKDLRVEQVTHYLSEEELIREFGTNGWKQLPDAIQNKYRFIPAEVVVEEHHIGVYASKTGRHMIKAYHEWR